MFEHKRLRRPMASLLPLIRLSVVPQGCKQVCVQLLGVLPAVVLFSILIAVSVIRFLPVQDIGLYVGYVPVMVFSIAAVLYIFFVAVCVVKPSGLVSSIHYDLGEMLLRRRSFAMVAGMGELYRQWVLKLFFVPVMFTFSYTNVLALRGVVDSFSYDVVAFVSLLTVLFYSVDVFLGLIGYLMSFASIDAHIRSTQPRLFGWVVCLICYPPASMLLFSYLNFHQAPLWHTLFSEHQVLLYVWAILIVVANALYAWATIIFGVRFSNLTNRGIITNGPYRFFKHPAYVGKNVAWWLMYMPILTILPLGALSFTIIQLGVFNYIYYLRAKTEEEHLREDPTYRLYEEWIAVHGVYPRVRRFFSTLF